MSAATMVDKRSRTKSEPVATSERAVATVVIGELGGKVTSYQIAQSFFVTGPLKRRSEKKGVTSHERTSSVV